MVGGTLAAVAVLFSKMGTRLAFLVSFLDGIPRNLVMEMWGSKMWSLDSLKGWNSIQVYCLAATP